jgi:hypothetical protein
MLRRLHCKAWKVGNARTGRWLPGEFSEPLVAIRAAGEAAEISPEWHRELFDDGEVGIRLLTPPASRR